MRSVTAHDMVLHEALRQAWTVRTINAQGTKRCQKWHKTSIDIHDPHCYVHTTMQRIDTQVRTTNTYIRVRSVVTHDVTKYVCTWYAALIHMVRRVDTKDTKHRWIDTRDTKHKRNVWCEELLHTDHTKHWYKWYEAVVHWYMWYEEQAHCMVRRIAAHTYVIRSIDTYGTKPSHTWGEALLVRRERCVKHEKQQQSTGVPSDGAASTRVFGRFYSRPTYQTKSSMYKTQYITRSTVSVSGGGRVLLQMVDVRFFGLSKKSGVFATWIIAKKTTEAWEKP